MINLQGFLTPIAFWLGLITPPAPPPSDPPTVTILCYHTFDTALPSAFNLASGRFEEQMRYLWVQKIPVISLDDAVAHLRLGKPIPDGSVVITIDDGYKSARTVAWPILQKYGFPFTLYVYPAAISKLRSALTWHDLRYLSAMGVDIQSHTLTHPLLTHPKKAMSPQEYAVWLDKELGESRRILQDELKKPVRHLAYAYGGYNEHVVSRVQAAGYWSATTCDTANVTRNVKPFMMNRRLVFSDTTTKAFVQGLRGRELTLIKQAPRDGEYVAEMPKTIAAQVVNRAQIIPDTLRIRVDHIRGAHPVDYHPDTGELRFTIPPTSFRGYFFVTLTAQDRVNPSIRRQATWLFLTRKNKPKK